MGAAKLNVASDCARVEGVFSQCFVASERTLLLGGASEPIYLPASAANSLHHLYYRDDYIASALHEAAHWCIAGTARREQVDFGYWYAPEGRNPGQQAAFEAVEVKPQALEWFFSVACGQRFRVSVDNFAPDGELPNTGSFCQRVTRQAIAYRANGLPPRAQQFFTALAAEFGTRATVPQLRFDAGELA